MKRSHGSALAAGLLTCLLLPAATRAQDTVRTITGHALVGVAGSLDDSSTGAGNLDFQLGIEIETRALSAVGVRLGSIDFGDFSNVTDASLDYITVSGEYRSSESFYTGGLYFGLGYYRFDAILLGGGPTDETGLGGVLGVDGHFRVNDRFDVITEISFHYAPVGVIDTFANGLIGVGVKF